MKSALDRIGLLFSGNGAFFGNKKPPEVGFDDIGQNMPHLNNIEKVVICK